MYPNRERLVTNLLLAAAALAVTLGFLGTLDVTKLPFLGYQSANRVVQAVNPGGPAEAAGLQVGDVVITIDGIDVDDRQALRDLRPLRAGIVRHYGVERDGETRNVEVRVASVSPARMLTSRLNYVIGLGFLICGLVVWCKTKTPTSHLFAWLGVCAVLVFSDQILGSSQAVGNVISWFWMLVTLLAVTLFLHFALVFPERRGLIERRGVRVAMYAPVVLQAVLLPVLLLNPAANAVSRTLVTWQPRVFLVLALAALVASFVKASAEERRARGLNVLLWGAVLAIAPYVVLTTLPLLLQGPVPGSQQASLAFLFLPLALGYALLKDRPATGDIRLRAEAVT